MAEECMEIAQRCSKAARFGIDEKEPGQNLDNITRINSEYCDFLGITELASELNLFDINVNREQIDKKKAKILKYMQYSKERGQLHD